LKLLALFLKIKKKYDGPSSHRIFFLLQTEFFIILQPQAYGIFGEEGKRLKKGHITHTIIEKRRQYYISH